MATMTLKPDVVLWKRQGGNWVYCDGLRGVLKQNGGLWMPVRRAYDSDLGYGAWEPCQRFASGAAMCYTTLTIAQQNALR